MLPTPRALTATLIAYALCASLLSACGDDSANTQATDTSTTTTATDADSTSDDANTSTSTNTSNDASTTDASSDDASTRDDANADAEDGVNPGITCDFPTPRQANEASAIGAQAAKCGQAPYGWLNDPSLGDVVGYGARLPLTAQAINDLAASEGITLPQPAVHDVRVIQYRYVTQAHGVATEATALAAFPTDLADDAAPLPTLLILHGTSGFNDGCAPSSTLDAQGFAALFASFGYFVVAPDYIGLKGLGDPTGYLHPYLVGEPTAMASLDSVRAAGKLPEARRGSACAAPEVVVLGGSQGGHAALWLDRLAPYYAPELDIAGIVATVPPADLLGQATRALKAPVSATGNTIAMLATQSDWYGLRARLGEVFVSPLDIDLPAVLASSCDPGDAIDDLNITDLAQVFQAPILQAAADDVLGELQPWGCLFSENGLTTTSTPRLGGQPDHYGILMIMGEADQLVNTPIERGSFVAMCADQDMPLQYLECAGAKHTATTVWAIPEILSFIDDRIAHKPFASALTCQLSAPTRCLGTPADQP